MIKPVRAPCRKGLPLPALLVLLAAVLAAPLPCAAALRVAVISDLNGSYGSTQYERSVDEAVARISTLQSGLVISTGDMVAGQRLHPPLAEPAVTAMWTAFHAKVSEPLARELIPLAVTRVGALEEAQSRWLDALLTRHGGQYRYRVVFSHLPIYPFTQGRETDISADHELEALLRRHGVEMYLSGHHHAFYPGSHGGIRYVSQACLGGGPRFAQALDLRTLPERIVSRYGTLVRDDLRQPVHAAPKVAALQSILPAH